MILNPPGNTAHETGIDGLAPIKIQFDDMVSWFSFYRYSRGVNRQGLPRRRASYQAIQVLQHSLLLRRDVGVPHHHQEDYSFFVGVVSGPVQIARVHAKKPDLRGSTAEGSGGKVEQGRPGKHNTRITTMVFHGRRGLV